MNYVKPSRGVFRVVEGELFAFPFTGGTTKEINPGETLFALIVEHFTRKNV